MNRYEILTGKELPEPVMGVDVGTKDSTSVWATVQSKFISDNDISTAFGEQLDKLAESVAIVTRESSLVQIAPPAMVRMRINEMLQPGDLIRVDGQGNVRKIAPGLVPLGIVVQPVDENREVIVRTYTMDEQVQYTQRIEEANNRAQSAAAMARDYEAASAQETREIVPERDRVEELFRLAEQMDAGVDTTSIRNEAQRIDSGVNEIGGGGDTSGELYIHDGNSSSGVSGVSGSIEAHPFHLGPLHEHPRMQQQLKVPDNHVIVDRNEWSRARQRRGHR